MRNPRAATLAELDRLAAQAAARGVSLFTTWHSRFDSKVADTARWLAGRPVQGGRITSREGARRWHPGQDWLWQPGGLGVFDPGINLLAILMLLCGAARTARLLGPEDAHTPIATTLAL